MGDRGMGGALRKRVLRVLRLRHGRPFGTLCRAFTVHHVSLLTTNRVDPASWRGALESHARSAVRALTRGFNSFPVQK